MKKIKGLESQLRQAILDSRLTRNEIIQKSGIDRAQLSYFINGKRSLTLKSAEKIVDILGFELRPKKER